jgi:hypothetical protein
MTLTVPGGRPSQRGGAGRLEDRGAAGRERGGQLRRQLVQRVIPRRDGGDHAGRLPDEQGIAHAGLHGKVREDVRYRAEHVHRQADLHSPRRGDGRPDLAAHCLGELLTARFEAVGDGPERGGPFRDGCLRPRRKRSLGSRDRPLDLRTAAARHAAHDLLGPAVDHVDVAVRLRLHPPPADIELFTNLHREPPKAGVTR